VLLPHLGSATYEARQAMWDLAWANLLRGVRGEVVVNPV
jgi:lactate dehydrogenase-like 2-hydroxyacid dehydrogenase